MLAYNLTSIDYVQPLVNICEKYSKHFKVDIVCGHYVVDGSSYLGVCSMCPNVVDIVPVLPERLDEGIEDKYFAFLQDVRRIGREHLENKE